MGFWSGYLYICTNRKLFFDCNKRQATITSSSNDHGDEFNWVESLLFLNRASSTLLVTRTKRISTAEIFDQN